MVQKQQAPRRSYNPYLISDFPKPEELAGPNKLSVFFQSFKNNIQKEVQNLGKK